MSKFILIHDKKRGYLLNGKSIEENDIIVLLSDFANRKKDFDLKLVLDYWVMLKESGHNGFYLKDFHQVTKDKREAIRK